MVINDINCDLNLYFSNNHRVYLYFLIAKQFFDIKFTK
jgi:hypothetical protein